MSIIPRGRHVEPPMIGTVVSFTGLARRWGRRAFACVLSVGDVYRRAMSPPAWSWSPSSPRWIGGELMGERRDGLGGVHAPRRGLPYRLQPAGSGPAGDGRDADAKLLRHLTGAEKRCRHHRSFRRTYRGHDIRLSFIG